MSFHYHLPPQRVAEDDLILAVEPALRCAIQREINRLHLEGTRSERIAAAERVFQIGTALAAALVDRLDDLTDPADSGIT